MKYAYLKCLKQLKLFRKEIIGEINVKRGNMFFTWIMDKTKLIMVEKDNYYIYNNIKKYTLPNYVITKYLFNKSNNVIKGIIKKNYKLKDDKFIFYNSEISYNEVKLLMKYILYKRGNVVWMNFGFNIGNEFGGMHPAVILKNCDNDLFVIPISSKKPIEYKKIEQELNNKKISYEDFSKRKSLITEIIELHKINNYKNMLRWIRITRMKKVSILRINFSGTIGTLDGSYLDIISDRISNEFGIKNIVK